jgi:uncharacterized OB-fold protein
MREPDYCPVCGSIDIQSDGTCAHCGSEAEHR